MKLKYGMKLGDKIFLVLIMVWLLWMGWFNFVKPLLNHPPEMPRDYEKYRGKSEEPNY